MDKKVIVVGVGGVGMAHVCAIVRTGGRVIAMIDKDRHILMQAAHGWVNQWDDKTEWVEKQAGCLYADNLLEPEIMALQPDIVAVCVPPHALMPLAIQAANVFPNSLILVEKPVWEYKPLIAEIGDRLYMSSEYIYYDALLLAVREAENLVIFSGDLTNRTRWGYRISIGQDYLPHLVGLLFVAYGGGKEYGWLSYKAGLDVAAGVLRWGDKVFHVRMMRHECLPFEFIIDGKRFTWQDDLFDRQYQASPPGLPASIISAAMEIARHKEFPGA